MILGSTNQLETEEEDSASTIPRLKVAFLEWTLSNVQWMVTEGEDKELYILILSRASKVEDE